MRKLLLADDSVTIQRVIELTFSGEDIQVVAVNDGEQAISRIPAEQPDVVLADIGMPRKGGYDVASFVKGRPDLSHIPVLLLAGAFEPVDQTRAEQVGADGVLIKPFEPRQVIERVKELLAAVRPTIAAELVPQPVAIEPAPVEAFSAEAASVQAAPIETVPIETVPIETAPIETMPLATATVAESPVETPAAPEIQTLDELFESLNQALTERSERTVAAVAPAVPAVPEPPAAPPAAVESAEATDEQPTSSWPVKQEWMTPTMPDDRSLDGAFDRTLFKTGSRPSTSAATLDDYFDRLSAAFSHTHADGSAETLPDRIEDFGNVAPPEPPAASHEWLAQVVEPQGLQAFETGEGDDNPILGAVSTLMASPNGNGTYAPPEPPATVVHAHAAEGAKTTPWNAGGVPGTDTQLVDLVTERVLTRLVPELTESLRRLVREEIARTRQY